MSFVIATLPDPLHTHFSLLFDRDAEAIQWAAQDEQYLYDSSWLPWETEEPSLTHLGDQDQEADREDKRERQPGVIVFRKENSDKPTNGQQPFNEALAVFIVGEEATRGIHRKQFENAAAWIAILQKAGAATPPPISILGPSFSGSFPSLAQLLADGAIHQLLSYETADRKLATRQVRVFSGSANSQSAVTWFGRLSSTGGKTAAEQLGKPASPDPRLQGFDISVHSFLESDRAMLRRYCDYLNETWLDTSRVAVISEDETAYGTGNDPCPGSISLSYPRDISALRAAYQTQSIFSSGSPQQSADTQRRNLPSDLADPAGHAHDTIPAYGGNQTPLSQESNLLGIVSVLRAHRIQYLVLRSSNTLDPLFLSNFFRRAYPEGRVIILGSDLLFQRERGSTGISGVMMLSTYPLFPWGQDWTGWPTTHGGASHRVFGEDIVEGNYIAARFLLHDPFPLGDDTPRCSFNDSTRCFLPANVMAKTFSIADYRAPYWTVSPSCKDAPASAECQAYLKPTTWLSVLGRGDFYPLASLRDSKDEKKNPDDHPHEDRTGMPFSMKLCLIFILLIAGFHAACCWSASFTAKPPFRARFATTQNWSSFGDWRHFVLISVGSGAVGLMALVASWSCGAFSTTGDPLPNPWLIRGFLTVATGIGLGSILVNSWIIRRLEDDRIKTEPESAGAGNWLRRRTMLSLILFIVAIVMFCLVFVLPIERILTVANRVPTYWRAMNITTGVSPMVPFLSLFVGIYAWFWCSLHGLALFGIDRPVLPSMSSLRVKDKRAIEQDFLCMFSREVAGQTETAAVPMGKSTLYAGLTLFVLFAVVGYVLAPPVPLRSLGATSYGLIFCLALDFCLSLLLAEVWQLWRTWNQLKQLLVFLDRLPIRRTMAALRGFSWGSVWKMSGNVIEVRYKLLSRQFENLNHLVAISDDLPKDPDDEDPETRHGWRKALDNAMDARDPFVEWYSGKYSDPHAGSLKTLETFQDRVAELAGKVLTRVLIPLWRSEKESLILELGVLPEQQRAAEKAPLPPAEEHIRNAEELVCLPYLGFIQNMLGRMRTLVLGIVWLFVAVTVSVSTYPFDPRPALSGTMICLFLVLGISISLVYADMHRDTTLSHVTNTNPGELGTEFWVKLIGFGVAPFLGLLTTVFPGVADFVFSWLQPGLASLK